jgi:hypothetical protein
MCKKPVSIGRTWILMTLMFATVLLGQVPVADVEVILLEPPPPITPPDSFGTFSFMIINHGPDDAGDPFPAPTVSLLLATQPDLPYSVEFGRPILLASDPDSDCFVNSGIPSPPPGQPPTVFYFAQFYGLEPGATAQCIVNYYVKPHLVEDLSMNWKYFPILSTDPDESNDTFLINFRLGLAEPIPTLTPTGSVVLVVALFVAFAVLRRRRWIQGTNGSEDDDGPSQAPLGVFDR